MPIDPYFLDEERRTPAPEVHPVDRTRWIAAGTALVLAGLFGAGWFSMTWAYVFLGVMVLVIAALAVWMYGARFEQDGMESLFFRRSLLTDIALGEHDRSAWPSMLLVVAIAVTIGAAIMLAGRHSQLLNTQSGKSLPRANP